MSDEDTQTKKTFWEEIEVAGDQLVERVKELAAEGNVRQLKIISDDGDVFFEAPLTIGLAVSGVVVLAAPWIAVLGVIAGLVKRVKIEVERSEDPKDETAK
jgi:hypothetical protein